MLRCTGLERRGHAAWPGSEDRPSAPGPAGPRPAPAPPRDHRHGTHTARSTRLAAPPGSGASPRTRAPAEPWPLDPGRPAGAAPQPAGAGWAETEAAGLRHSRRRGALGHVRPAVGCRRRCCRGAPSGAAAGQPSGRAGRKEIHKTSSSLQINKSNTTSHTHAHTHTRFRGPGTAEATSRAGSGKQRVKGNRGKGLGSQGQPLRPGRCPRRCPGNAEGGTRGQGCGGPGGPQHGGQRPRCRGSGWHVTRSHSEPGLRFPAGARRGRSAARTSPGTGDSPAVGARRGRAGCRPPRLAPSTAHPKPWPWPWPWRWPEPPTTGASVARGGAWGRNGASTKSPQLALRPSFPWTRDLAASGPGEALPRWAGGRAGGGAGGRRPSRSRARAAGASVSGARAPGRACGRMQSAGTRERGQAHAHPPGWTWTARSSPLGAEDLAAGAWPPGEPSRPEPGAGETDGRGRSDGRPHAGSGRSAGARGGSARRAPLGWGPPTGRRRRLSPSRSPSPRRPPGRAPAARAAAPLRSAPHRQKTPC